MSIKSVKEALRAKRETIPAFTRDDYLSLRAVPLNLALTGKTYGALLKGLYYLFCGDTNSGKTWAMLVAFAEASINPAFDDYNFYYDATEHGALMDFTRYFGPSMAKRIQPPFRNKDGTPGCSSNIPHFFRNVKRACAEGPCIYALDSFDPLIAVADAKKSKQDESKQNRGKASSGSYGTARAKEINTGMREVVTDTIWNSKSILIGIAQSRDAIGNKMPRFGPPEKTRAGGYSLSFYATCEIWFSKRCDIFRKSRGKRRPVGILSKVKVKRTRVTGQQHSIFIPIHHSTGMDNIGSCIDFLLEESHWHLQKKAKQYVGMDYASMNPNIVAPEFDFEGRRENLIMRIEMTDQEEKLYKLVRKVWREIEEETKVERKNPYE